MVTGASWPNAALSVQTSGINRQGSRRGVFLEPVANSCFGGVWTRRGDARRAEEWSGEEWELFFALLD